MSNETIFVMVGGFLGSGKTSALLKLAKWLTDEKELRIGLITNDQGEGLVDTALGRNQQLSTEEIPGGCFCCRSDLLVEATERLTLSAQPEVFLAEPVGSCTDLVATVSLPLEKIYGTGFRIAPLSVLVDPFRAEKMLDLLDQKSSRLSGHDDVAYIYSKQLEEAEFIVINKIDVVSAARVDALQKRLEKRYPYARIHLVSVREGKGLIDWWEKLLERKMSVERIMNVDYDRYARGEALLGWLNARFHLASMNSFDANQVLQNTIDGIAWEFRARNLIVSHLKATLEPDSAGLAGDSNATGRLPNLAAMQWVNNEFEPEFTLRSVEEYSTGTLTLNLRAQASPDDLRQIVEKLIGKTPATITAKCLEMSAFRPGAPKPIHRVAEVDASADISSH